MPNIHEALTKTGIILFFSAVTILALNDPAYAYADPGTAGLLYQIVVIIFASVVSYFLFLKDLFRRMFKRNSDEQHEEPDQQD